MLHTHSTYNITLHGPLHNNTATKLSQFTIHATSQAQKSTPLHRQNSHATTQAKLRQYPCHSVHECALLHMSRLPRLSPRLNHSIRLPAITICRYGYRGDVRAPAMRQSEATAKPPQACVEQTPCVNRTHY